MLKSKANWIYDEYVEQDDIEKLDQLDSSETVKKLLIKRGLTSVEEAEKFLKPNLNDLQAPAFFRDIDKAVSRIEDAMENGEMIVIYGDYDADGVCSTTVLLKTLTELGAYCDFYIPNRFTEGYGLNKKAIEHLVNEGCQLIITVDNGIASFDEVDYANELGVDVIITDHHEIQADVPNAYAVIHPAYSPDYDFKELAGVGIAFKLAEQLLGFFPEQFLDLVAVGTIADLVPLVGENRILVYHGLKVLNETEHVGLSVLMDMCKLEKPLNEEDIGFMIGPRLNAAGRLRSASLAVQLLMSEYVEEASQLASEIDEINKERQQIVTKIVSEAEKMVNPEQAIIILYKEDWHEGVLGIAASRLVNKFDRPVIMLNYNAEKDEYKGSARSIPAFDLFKSCMAFRHLFINFGGHSQAAGMTISSEHLEELIESLNSFILAELDEDDFKQEINISETVKLKELDESLVHELYELAPFGMKNPKPLIEVAAIPADIRQIGKDNKHLKMQFTDDNAKLDLVGFNKGDLFDYISKSVTVHTVGNLGINEWNGNRTVQLIIEDIKIDQFQLFDYRGKNKWLDLSTYTSFYENYLILHNEADIDRDFHQHVLSFADDFTEVGQVDLLVISTLPPTLDHLKDLLIATRPNNVLVNFDVGSSYLTPLPSRDDFKWLYGYIYKHKRVDMKRDIKRIMQMKAWSKADIVFMVQVFIDLQFIEAESGVVHINQSAPKRDLRTSAVYKEKEKEKQLEERLYFSSDIELKDMCLSWMTHENEGAKEEVTHGL